MEREIEHNGGYNCRLRIVHAHERQSNGGLTLIGGSERGHMQSVGWKQA